MNIGYMGGKLIIAAVFLWSLTLQAGTTVIVDLPSTGTDVAIGVSTAKTYTHTLDFGTATGSPVTLNGVAFDQGPTASFTAAFTGASRGNSYTITDTRAAINIALHAGVSHSQADGQSGALLTDMIYHNSSSTVGAGISVTLSGLTAGTTYSTRVYYRSWASGATARTISFKADGGSHGVFNDTLDVEWDAGGAHYVNYTFVSDDTNVTLKFLTNDANNGVHLYALTNEVFSSSPVIVTPAANPDPANGVKYLEVAALTQLGWDAGKKNDPPIVNSDITRHYLYLSKSSNLSGITPVSILADGNGDGSVDSRPVYALPQTLEKNATYYWRVDESLGASGPGDSEHILAGPVWSFQTEKTDYPSLQTKMIWTGEADLGTNHFRAFRKTFTLDNVPASAVLNIFADNIYLLWVNGKYVKRGPSRFDPKGPNYDSVDIAAHLQSGKNVIAVQVMAYRSGTGGQRMKHLPGLTAELIADGASILTTGTSWKWSSQTQYSVAAVNWGFVRFNNDGRNEPVGWETTGFNDSGWSSAVLIDGYQWGPIRASFIPMLPERDAAVNPPAILPAGLTYPLTLAQGESVTVNLGRMVLGYEVVDLQAASGAVLEILHGQRFGKEMTDSYDSTNTYTARDGRQIFMASDSYGHHYLKVTAKTGSIKVYGIKVVERRYPYEDSSAFQTNDAFLNDFWGRAVHTLKMNSEDGYMDCPLRERSEWMGDAAVVEYPCTRVAFGITQTPGEVSKSDAGLMKQMIRHTAQSKLSDGRLKAHVPSDRWDIHGYIEDYSCLWVQMVRDVYDHTADTALVSEVWPDLVDQMQWFLDRRTSRGLVNAREFVIFDNPQKYNVCEGATLNAFIYKALRDSAYLAGAIGQAQKQTEYSAAADALYTDFNRELWNESAGNYYAGLDNPNDIPSATPSKLSPSTHAVLLSLHAGIVPADRLERVRNYLFSTWPSGVGMPYTHWWLFEEFYKADAARWDSEALNSIRTKWADVMQRTDTGTLTESYNGGEASHNFGASPVYYLAAHVLGARMDGPVGEKRILIEPRLGDLTSVRGAAVTEHGPVPVSWVQSGSRWDFSFTVPAGITANVRLPIGTVFGSAIMDGRPLVPGENGVVHKGRWLEFSIGSGRHSGFWSSPSGL